MNEDKLIEKLTEEFKKMKEEVEDLDKNKKSFEDWMLLILKSLRMILLEINKKEVKENLKEIDKGIKSMETLKKLNIKIEKLWPDFVELLSSQANNMKVDEKDFEKVKEFIDKSKLN